MQEFFEMLRTANIFEAFDYARPWHAFDAPSDETLLSINHERDYCNCFSNIALFTSI